MKSSNTPLILSSLNSLKSLLVSAQEIIIEHIDSLVLILLKLSKYKESMYVRENSILVLEQFTQFPYRVIYPSQQLVIKELFTVLDDRKRIVRRAAAKCRNEWFV